jgi:hypothetical protein
MDQVPAPPSGLIEDVEVLLFTSHSGGQNGVPPKGNLIAGLASHFFTSSGPLLSRLIHSNYLNPAGGPPCLHDAQHGVERLTFSKARALG